MNASSSARDWAFTLYSSAESPVFPALFPHKPFYLPCYEIGLFPLVAGFVIPYPLALLIPGPEFLALPAVILPDHVVGGIEYSAGGTVILLQLDDLRVAEVFFEFRILRMSAPLKL